MPVHCCTCSARTPKWHPAIPGLHTPFPLPLAPHPHSCPWHLIPAAAGLHLHHDHSAHDASSVHISDPSDAVKSAARRGCARRHDHVSEGATFTPTATPSSPAASTPCSARGCDPGCGSIRGLRPIQPCRLRVQRHSWSFLCLFRCANPPFPPMCVQRQSWSFFCLFRFPPPPLDGFVSGVITPPPPPPPL